MWKVDTTLLYIRTDLDGFILTLQLLVGFLPLANNCPRLIHLPLQR